MNLRIAAAVMGLLICVTGCTNGSSSNSAGGGNGNGNGQHATANKTKKAKPTPHYTASQQQAIGSAQDYLNTQAFSKQGLIDQLDSKYGSQYKKKDAIFAVDHIKVDWNAEAVKAAKTYLQTQHFSCSGLVQQLDSSYGSKFTPAQAQYAGKKVGLC